MNTKEASSLSTSIAIAHAPVLAALHGRCFTEPGARKWNTAAFGDLIAMAGTFGTIIMTADLPTGFILALMAGDDCEIVTFGVDPAFRRRGQGGTLLAEVQAGAATRGAARIVLEVAADNGPALGFYDRCGFVTIGRRAGYYRRDSGNRVDALVLGLDL